MKYDWNEFYEDRRNVADGDSNILINGAPLFRLRRRAPNRAVFHFIYC